MKKAAGTLLYRIKDDTVEVLLVHPSGNYNRSKPWSIPKGEPEPKESLEQAARRETIEETGVKPKKLIDLGFIEYTKSKKRVYCFAGIAPTGQKPTCASWEVDRAEFLPMKKASKLIHRDQAELLERLVERLEQGNGKTAL